jgi:hypothetical protein
MQVVLDEIIERTAQISNEERDKLIEVLQEQKEQNQKNGKQGYVHPNTIWIKEHHAEHQGKYVAVDNGKLVGLFRSDLCPFLSLPFSSSELLMLSVI